MKRLVAILAVLSIAAIVLAVSQGAFTRDRARPVIPAPEVIAPRLEQPASGNSQAR